MRAAATILAALVLASGCGGDDEGAPIPSGQATELLRRLDSVSGRIADGSAGACDDAIEGEDNDLDLVQDQIDALPADVDADVRDALQQSFDRLFELVSDRCRELQAEEQDTETVETTPETTPTEPLPTATEPPPPTDPVPTTPEVPTTPTVPDPGGDENDDSGGAAPQDGG